MQGLFSCAKGKETANGDNDTGNNAQRAQNFNAENDTDKRNNGRAGFDGITCEKRIGIC